MEITILTEQKVKAGVSMDMKIANVLVTATKTLDELIAKLSDWKVHTEGTESNTS